MLLEKSSLCESRPAIHACQTNRAPHHRHIQRAGAPAPYQTHGSDNAAGSANIQLPTMHTKPNAAVPTQSVPCSLV